MFIDRRQVEASAFSPSGAYMYYSTAACVYRAPGAFIAGHRWKRLPLAPEGRHVYSTAAEVQAERLFLAPEGRHVYRQATGVCL